MSLYYFKTSHTETNSSSLIFESINASAIKTSIANNLVFGSNNISSC